MLAMIWSERKIYLVFHNCFYLLTNCGCPGTLKRQPGKSLMAMRRLKLATYGLHCHIKIAASTVAYIILSHRVRVNRSY